MLGGCEGSTATANNRHDNYISRHISYPEQPVSSEQWAVGERRHSRWIDANRIHNPRMSPPIIYAVDCDCFWPSALCRTRGHLFAIPRPVIAGTISDIAAQSAYRAPCTVLCVVYPQNAPTTAQHPAGVPTHSKILRCCQPNYSSTEMDYPPSNLAV